MIGQGRLLAALTAGLICGIGGGLTLRSDPPHRTDLLAFRELGPTAQPSLVDAWPLAGLSSAPATDGGLGLASPDRPVYRHSIVPGGVYSAAEAAEAAARMPQVAKHYQRVDLRHLAPTRLPRDSTYYASYRRDNSIFWTSYRLRVDPGEIVLSDGEHLVRARCGNLLSEEPLKPRLPPALEPIAPELTAVDILPLPTIATQPDSGGGIWIKLLPILPLVVFPPGGGGGGGGGGWDRPDPKPPVPEPSPGALIALGLGAVAAGQMLSAHRRRALQRRWGCRPAPMQADDDEDGDSGPASPGTGGAGLA
jgi:hypothetical protein